MFDFSSYHYANGEPSLTGIIRSEYSDFIVDEKFKESMLYSQKVIDIISKFEYKADKTGIVHVNFGKSDFTNEQLIENLQALYQSIEQNRPSGVKGKYFKSLFICTTMGSSIQLNLDIFDLLFFLLYLKVLDNLDFPSLPMISISI